MVKIHFLQKVLKIWSSIRKKNKKKFSITGGGGGGVHTHYGIFHNFFLFFFWTLPLDEIVILMIVFLLWISVVSLFIHRLVQNAYCTDKLNSKFSGGEKFATYNQDFSILNIPKETMTWKTGTLKISSLKLDR